MRPLFFSGLSVLLMFALTGCETSMHHAQTDFAFEHRDSGHSHHDSSYRNRWVKGLAGVQVHRLNPSLTQDLTGIARHFNKPVYVVSGCRSIAHNRQVGGVKGSYHTRCLAADFYIPGVSKRKVARYIRTLSHRGGIGLYCGKGSVHLDVGPKRDWYWGCRKKKQNLIARQAPGKRPAHRQKNQKTASAADSGIKSVQDLQTGLRGMNTKMGLVAN